MLSLSGVGYLQLGKRDHAIGWLNRMAAEAAKQDQTVYVHKVVWSSKPGDIVDRNVNAAQASAFSRQVIEKTRRHQRHHPGHQALVPATVS